MFGTTIYREKEFENFCKKRLRNTQFVLGRTKEEIVGCELATDPGQSEVDKVEDITELLSKKSTASAKQTPERRDLLDPDMSKAEIEKRAAMDIPVE